MPRSWLTTVDRGVLACIVFAIVVMMVSTLGSAAEIGRTPWWAVPFGAQLGAAALCGVAIRAGRSRGLAIGATSLACLSLPAAALLVAAADLPGYASHTLPANAVQLVHLVVIGIGVRITTGLAVIVATGPIGVAALALSADLPVAQAVDRWILPAASSITVLIILSHMRAAARRADDLTAATRAAAVAARTASNAERARDEARRLVHDEIITALRAIELERPRAAIERDSRRALQALTATPVAAEDLASDLRRGVRTPVRTVGQGWLSALPPRVVDAFRGAASEALRNVDGHAGATSATVRVEQVDDSWLLEVSDDGVGFRPGSVPGFGIRESISRRMDDVGGQGRVTSTADGTSVRLLWPAESGRERPPAERPRFQGRVYALTVLPSVVTNGYLALRFPGEPGWSGVALWAGLTVLILGLAVVLGRRSPAFADPVLRWPAVTACCLPACVLVFVGVGALQPDGALLSAESWVVGYASLCAILVSFGARAPLAAAAGGGLLCATAVAAWRDPSLGQFTPLGAYLATIVNGGTAFVAAVTLRKASRSIARSVAIQNAQDEETGWQTELARARERFLARLDHDVMPFLASVVDGTPSDAPRAAAMLAAQCRDELGVASHDRIDELTASAVGADVVILDLWLEEGPSFDQIGPLVERGSTVLLYTSEQTAVPLRRSVELGASGVLLKSDPLDTLVAAVHAAHAGEFCCSGPLAHALLTDPTIADLSTRQVEILQAIADGLPYPKAAQLLQISEGTLKTHLGRTREKFRSVGIEAGNSNDMIRLARAQGHMP